MEELGKLLLFFGASLVAIGGLIVVLGKIVGLGRLPGDIVIQTENFSCIVPLVSSIVLSIVLTILLNVIVRLWNR